MSLDCWFAEDVARTLRAIDLANAVAASRMATNARDAAYREGYADALRAVAVAFGIGEREAGERLRLPAQFASIEHVR